MSRVAALGCFGGWLRLVLALTLGASVSGMPFTENHH